MSSDHTPNYPKLDLSKWAKYPFLAIVAGVVFLLIGVGLSENHLQQLGFSWLVGFMFCLSLGLGGWCLVMIHHLVDASWSAPIRRVTEALSSFLGPVMIVLFLPVAILAPKIYPWLRAPLVNHPDHPITSKYPLFTVPGYYISAALMLLGWWFFSNRLRVWSLRQDETGAAKCTGKMRVYSSLGIVFFAISVTVGSITWISGLMDDWYSTMFGVTYFAASVWLALATTYLIVLALDRAEILNGVVKEKTYYFTGSLLFAFTVFWGYVCFMQYFIVWNANMPEETFWYVLREKGTWKYIGQYVMIFGHFFVPFLFLLRIDFKLKLSVMGPLVAWCWLMHFVDMEFQIIPALHPNSIFAAGLISDLGAVLVMSGILAKVFVGVFSRHPAYPLRDPRMAEALEIYVPPHSDISTAPERAK